MNRNLINLFLRIAVISCFYCHGFMALRAANVPYSEWNVWLQRLLPFAGLDGAAFALRLFGTLDMLAVTLLLLPKIPNIAFIWTICWGFATCMSRLFFLGALGGDVWQNNVYPFAECITRFPNWMMPLLLYVRVGEPSRVLFKKVNMDFLVKVGVVGCTTAQILTYLVEWKGPIYPIEIIRTGMPLSLFHIHGGMALASLAAIVFVIVKGPQRWLGALTLLPMVSFIGWELIEAYYIKLPRGAVGAAIQLGEHIPLFLCFGLFFASREIKAEVAHEESLGHAA